MRLRTPGDVGAIIRERRRTLGLDQAALARKVGVSRLWINQMEHGKPGASLNLVLRTLAAVGVELSTDAHAQPLEDQPIAIVPDINAPDINAIVHAARSKNRKMP